MNHKDIWTIYQAERAMTAAEAAEAQRRLLTDPTDVRGMIDTLLALAQHNPDPAFRHLLNAFITATINEILVPQIKADDATALACGAILARLMRETAPVPRGRPRPGKKASAA